MMGFLRWFRRKTNSEACPSDGIDCGGVMQRLYEYIDGELEDESLMEAIREHLEVCQKCYPRYCFESAFLRFLSEQKRVQAPPGLRRRIFQRILEEERRE